MEKQLNYVLNLTLEEMALRRVSVAVHNQPYVLASIAKWQSEYTRNIWYEPAMYRGRVLEERSWRKAVQDKISTLHLPKPFTDRIMPILKAVTSEIFKWKWTHLAYLSNSNDNFNVHVLEKLRWTSAGTVDYQKTAVELVNWDELELVKRFELACLYCLEDYIPVLWNKLPEENRTSYGEGGISEIKEVNLKLFLPYILKKRYRLDHMPRMLDSFKCAALHGNKTLTEYCFWKLPKRQREASLVRTAKDVILRIQCSDDDFDAMNEKLSDVLCSLLSLMTPAEQIGIFKKLPCKVLRCFLVWPWQDLFSDIADIIWTFLPERKYKSMLRKIKESIETSGYYFPNVFQNFFILSPVNFRNKLLDEEPAFFHAFFINEDTETIKVVLRNVYAGSRARLVSSDYGINLIWCWKDRWHVAEVFLREATLSKKKEKQIKEALKKFMQKVHKGFHPHIEFERERCKEFFEFLEKTDESQENKRSSEDEICIRPGRTSCGKRRKFD